MIQEISRKSPSIIRLHYFTPRNEIWIFTSTCDEKFKKRWISKIEALINKTFYFLQSQFIDSIKIITMFKIKNVAIVSLILCSLLIAFSGSHPTSSSGGYTSAPGDGVCSQCHTDNNTSLDGDYTVTGIPVDIEANTTYTVDIQLTNPNGNASRGGFQILALDEDNTQGGTWSNASTGSVLKTVIGKTYLGHQGSQSFPASNELNWTADWTAPDEEDATFNFYAVSILANGGNGNQNDRFLLQQFDATIPDVVIPLTLSIDLVANATCANSSDGSATVTISGGEAPYDIIWENGETTETATMLPVGNTFAVVTDAAGFSVEAEIAINSILELEIDIVDLNNASCFGTPDGSISLSVPNGIEPINYEWSNGETENTINNIFSGTYTVIATDANGCDATLDILITEPDELEINQTMDMPSCNGDEDGFIILSVTGGISPYSFSWEDGSQNESNFNLTAGTYLTTITDFNECITVISTELTEPLALNLDNTIIEHPVCNGDTNGTITVTPMGGISGYDYSWSNGSATQTISGLSEGEYMLTVTDSENCSQSETYTLLNQIELIISTSSTAESSPGASDGTATVEVISGGITPYEYEWSTGDITATANNLISGAYTVTVTDANGCSVDGMAVVSSGDCTLSTVVDILPVTCNADNNGSVLVTVENAIAPVSFLWSDGSIIGNRSDLAADTYSLIVFDNAGCSDTVMNIIISEPLELNAQISATPTTTNITSDGEIVITAGGGTAPYNIKLFDANSEEVAVNETGIFSNIPSGIYGALVIDDNGCNLTIDSIEVTFVTSTSDIFETYGILTYPNPVTHQLIVSVKEFASNLDISLRTIKGKLVLSDKGKSRVISIDLSNHAPGLYLLSVTDQKHTTTRKISIRH